MYNMYTKMLFSHVALGTVREATEVLHGWTWHLWSARRNNGRATASVRSNFCPKKRPSNVKMQNDAKQCHHNMLQGSRFIRFQWECLGKGYMLKVLVADWLIWASLL